jgi:hypothetical protein
MTNMLPGRATELSLTDKGPADNGGTRDEALRRLQIEPSPHGTAFIEHRRGAKRLVEASRHRGRRKTNTIDYAILLFRLGGFS